MHGHFRNLHVSLAFVLSPRSCFKYPNLLCSKRLSFFKHLTQSAKKSDLDISLTALIVRRLCINLLSTGFDLYLGSCNAPSFVKGHFLERQPNKYPPIHEPQSL
jgi:hypothetical protein